MELVPTTLLAPSYLCRPSTSQVVPTEYRHLSGAIIVTNQYSVTEYFSPGGSFSSGLPGKQVVASHATAPHSCTTLHAVRAGRLECLAGGSSCSRFACSSSPAVNHSNARSLPLCWSSLVVPRCSALPLQLVLPTFVTITETL